MELILIALFAVMLAFIVRGGFDAKVARQVFPILLVAYAARLVIHLLIARGAVIGYGSDNLYYEARALDVVAYWKREGFQYVTYEQINSLNNTATLPSHIFGLVIYLCGGPAPLACTALVALVACAACVIIYRLARLVGCDHPAAFRILVITAFMPAFMLHTSDTFKDGFNAFLVVFCIFLVCSNAQRPSLYKLVLLVPVLWALWCVRPYMVFMCGPAVILGVLSAKRGLSSRAAVIFAALPTLMLLYLADRHLGAPAQVMQEMLEFGQSQGRSANAIGGSSVVFDDGGQAWGSLWIKLTYMLLSPFPWMSGSLALQLGKIETMLWYYLLYVAIRGARRLWHSDRTMLMIIISFVVPSIIIYSTTVANIGLIFRQRIPIMMIVSLLSAVAWSKAPRAGQPSPPRRRQGEPAGHP